MLLSSQWQCAGFACYDLALGKLLVDFTYLFHIQWQVQYLKVSFTLPDFRYLPEVKGLEVQVPTWSGVFLQRGIQTAIFSMSSGLRHLKWMPKINLLFMFFKNFGHDICCQTSPVHWRAVNLKQFQTSSLLFYSLTVKVINSHRHSCVIFVVQCLIIDASWRLWVLSMFCCCCPYMLRVTARSGAHKTKLTYKNERISEWIGLIELIQAAMQGSEQSNLSTQRSYCDIYKNQLSSDGHLVINT